MYGKLLIAVGAVMMVATPSLAAPACRDAHGKFIKCPPAKPTTARCRLKGKFVKCGTPGAKPA